MKQITSFEYTVDEIKANLADYNKDILSKDIWEKIVADIVAKHGTIEEDSVVEIIEREAHVIAIDFGWATSIKEAIEGHTYVLCPEFAKAAESDAVRLIIKSSSNDILIDMSSTEIENLRIV